LVSWIDFILWSLKVKVFSRNSHFPDRVHNDIKTDEDIRLAWVLGGLNPARASFLLVAANPSRRGKNFLADTVPQCQTTAVQTHHQRTAVILTNSQPLAWENTKRHHAFLQSPAPAKGGNDGSLTHRKAS
jgi:hypothetical protein